MKTLIGPLDNIVIPKVAQPPKDHLPDYEVELVIVIGKAAKNVSEADALDYVLGYTGANDVRYSFPALPSEVNRILNSDMDRYHSASTRWLSRNGVFPRVSVSYLIIHIVLATYNPT